MSYNIISCKVKSLNNLIIPVKEFSENVQEKYRPEIEIIDAVSLEIAINYGDAVIAGTLNNGLITVSKVEIYGEGSGAFLHECFIPALGKSSGELSLRLAWEGDGEISRLTSTNGIVTDITDED